MARPSQNVDQALLAAGRALFPRHGCAGLSVRAVAQQAGVNPAMLHYHFGSREGFLAALLQQFYEELYASIELRLQADAPVLPRLEGALLQMAQFAQQRGDFIRRLWMDAQLGEEQARAFLRTNLPRHLGLIGQVVMQAQAEGAIVRRPLPLVLSFLMGSVIAPILFLAPLFGWLEQPCFANLNAGDPENLNQRIAWAIAALRTEGALP